MVRLWTDGQPGRKHTIWRLFNVVSPLEPHDRPGHLHVDLFRKLFIEKWTEIKVGPELRCLVWVGDVADAFVRYLFDDRAACQIFNLAGETSISTQQIAEGLRRFGLDHGLETKTTIQSEPAGPQRPLPSIHQTHARLGWRPATPPWSCLYKFVAGKARYIK
jgi:nucleoside-diphosphate-sugar epimerase